MYPLRHHIIPRADSLLARLSRGALGIIVKARDFVTIFYEPGRGSNFVPVFRYSRGVTAQIRRKWRAKWLWSAKPTCEATSAGRTPAARSRRASEIWTWI